MYVSGELNTLSQYNWEDKFANQKTYTDITLGNIYILCS